MYELMFNECMIFDTELEQELFLKYYYFIQYKAPTTDDILDQIGQNIKSHWRDMAHTLESAYVERFHEINENIKIN